MKNKFGYYDYYGIIRNRSVSDDSFYLTNELIHMNWGWGIMFINHKVVDSNGWCTYDYWITKPKNSNGDIKNYDYYKCMLKVRP